MELHNRMLEDSANPVPTECGVVELTCTMALGYRKHTETILIHLLGGGYEIYSPRIEQCDWTV